MINAPSSFIESLGTEPIEVFGFSSEAELEQALMPLMQEITEDNSLI